tara:strand:+ start:320 stop:904 length:585 start_codon:yes stop_codon:yes gene_type:complete
MADIEIKKADLQKLLNALFHLDNQYLELSVDEDEDLVKGEEASTWLEYYRSNDNQSDPDQIFHFMRDDDGNSHLNSFEANIDGLKEALVSHSELQSQYSDDEYISYLTNFVNNLKEDEIKIIPEKILKTFKQVSKPLKGEELLKRLSELPKDASKADQVRACGYFIESEDGTQKAQFMEFYSALLDAKEFNLDD